jgi:hypothetical protein
MKRLQRACVILCTPLLAALVRAKAGCDHSQHDCDGMQTRRIPSLSRCLWNPDFCPPSLSGGNALRPGSPVQVKRHIVLLLSRRCVSKVVVKGSGLAKALEDVSPVLARKPSP